MLHNQVKWQLLTPRRHQSSHRAVLALPRSLEDVEMVKFKRIPKKLVQIRLGRLGRRAKTAQWWLEVSSCHFILLQRL